MNIYTMETLTAKLIQDCGVKESSCKSYCCAVRAICNYWEQQGRNCKKPYQGYTKEGFFRLDKLSKISNSKKKNQYDNFFCRYCWLS